MNEILEQIGRVSNKTIFSYSCQTRTFEFLSPAVASVFGVSRQQAMADPQSLLAVVVPEDLAYAQPHWHKLMAGSETEEIEVRLIGSGTPQKAIRVEAYPIRDQVGKVVSVAGYAQDVTRQRQHEEYLAQYAARKNSMLEIVSHDLRGPIALVQSISHALNKDHVEGNHSEINNYTKFIQRACEDSIKLINDLLAQEHLESPKIQVKKKWIDVAAKARDVVESYQIAPNNTQTFRMETTADHMFAELDEIKFSQILNNLVSNAVKFTGADGVITVTIREEAEEMEIRVSDNGIGIPDKLQPLLFDKYTKAARPGLQGEQPLGIGLSIVRDLVEVQGGHIRVESQEQQGSTFIVVLPKRD